MQKYPKKSHFRHCLYEKNHIFGTENSTKGFRSQLYLVKYNSREVDGTLSFLLRGLLAFQDLLDVVEFVQGLDGGEVVDID